MQGMEAKIQAHKDVSSEGPVGIISDRLSWIELIGRMFGYRTVCPGLDR